MESLGESVTAVVIGASGGIGAAIAQELAQRPEIGRLHLFTRHGRAPDLPNAVHGRLDLEDEASIAEAAGSLSDTPRLLIVASGVLHGPDLRPERNWSEIDVQALKRNFAVNAAGPALVAKHFLPLLPKRDRSIVAMLSARVGSISDNRLGGWHAHRASKAALNMLIRTLSVELSRRRPEAVIMGLQPGTVDTQLAAPFLANVPKDRLFAPDIAARHLLKVMDEAGVEHSGRILDWAGNEVQP